MQKKKLASSLIRKFFSATPAFAKFNFCFYFCEKLGTEIKFESSSLFLFFITFCSNPGLFYLLRTYLRFKSEFNGWKVHQNVGSSWREASLKEISCEKILSPAPGFKPTTFRPMSSCLSHSLFTLVGLLLSHQIGPKLVACALGNFGGCQQADLAETRTFPELAHPDE